MKLKGSKRLSVFEFLRHQQLSSPKLTVSNRRPLDGLQIDCKTVGFFSKSVKKSVKRGVRVGPFIRGKIRRVLHKTVWSNTSKKNISKLQKVQNFACRIITGKRKFDHITPALRELRWLPVTSFLKYTLGVLAFKCVKGLAPSYLCHRFKTRDCVHDRNTRYKNNLNIPAYKSASGQRTFLYRATSFWNSLPCEIRGCDNLPIFKRHLKEFLSSF